MTERLNVTIIGAGLMGPGIAACASAAGHPTTLVDLDLSKADAGIVKTRQLLSQLAENEIIGMKAASAASDLLRADDDLERGCTGAFLVIEAIPEKLAAKQALFQRLDDMLPPEVILTSNTSGLRITEIAAKTRCKERIAATHFWYPGHLVPLVEIVMSAQTIEGVAQRLHGLLTSWGKAPVIVRRDLPGQLANRIFQAVIREALNIVEMGLASPEDVDTAIKMGMGIRFPVWGPLEHIDAVGLDLALSVQKDVLPGLNNSPEPPLLLRQMVDDGALGCKTGKGIYDWKVKELSELTARRDSFILHTLRYFRKDSP
jgi:3-hydroxybutyryl-CoA dehydrogenase